MTIGATALPESEGTCASCKACCCRLEVMLITDTCVPDRFIEWDKWGCQTMARLEDGWCAALDRNTMKCTICALGLNRRQIGKKWLLARMPSLSSPAP